MSNGNGTTTTGNGSNGTSNGTGVAQNDTVQTSGESGYSVPGGSTLKRLHFYDGKFLRAGDMTLEQRYISSLVHLSNQAGGDGVAHGLHTAYVPNEDALTVSAGLAIDPLGQLLLNSAMQVKVGVQTLIDATNRAVVRPGAAGVAGSGSFGPCAPPDQSTPTVDGGGYDLYLITLGHAEFACGTEPVYGKVCEEACATSTDRSFEVEGLVVRAIALPRPPMPVTTVPLGTQHLRSIVASWFYAQEWAMGGSLISGEGLRSDIWCQGANLVGRFGGAQAQNDVALGVIARAGSGTIFFDSWTARRERMEPPARRYWYGRMSMRPWEVYLAQILQFQCQLGGIAGNLVYGAVPPQKAAGAAAAAGALITQFQQSYETWLGSMNDKFLMEKKATSDMSKEAALGTATLPPSLLDLLQQLGSKLSILDCTLAPPTNRLLINGGIIELPPAGYLPVSPGQTTVNEQVRALMGEGVDLRFCVVRPDFVAHALEAAQHMERISLIQGLDPSGEKPKVDILVPDGEIVQSAAGTENVFDTTVTVSNGTDQLGSVRGVARGEVLASGGAAIYIAASRPFSKLQTKYPIGEVAYVAPTMKMAYPEKVMTATVMYAEQPPSNVVSIDSARTNAYRASAQPLVAATDGSLALALPAYHFEPADAPVPVIRAQESQPPPPPAPPPPAPPPPSGTTDQPKEGTGGLGAVASGWLEAQISENPFVLFPGQRPTPVTGRLIASGTVDGVQQLFEASVRGEFRVESNTTTPGGRQVVGTLFATYISGENLPKDGTTEHDCNAQSIRVRMGFAGNADGGTFGVKLYEIVVGASDILRVTGSVTWSGSPLVARVKAEDTKTPPEFSASATLTRTTDVLDTTNQAHMLAQRAIDTIALAYPVQGWREQATNLLFPQADTAGSELLVRATRDWVLFHRRRDKVCAVERPAPAPVKRLRYQVAVTTFSMYKGSYDIEGAVSNPIFDNDIVKRIGFIEFDEGSIMPIGGDDLTAAWQAAKLQNIVYWSAVGATSDEEQDVELQRIDAVEKLLGLQVSEQGRSWRMDPSAAWSAPDTDGFLLFFIDQEVVQAAPCELVYRLEAPRTDYDKLAEAFKLGNYDAVKSYQPKRIGIFHYSGTTVNPDSDVTNARDAWVNDTPGGVIDGIGMFARARMPTNDEQTIAFESGRRIATTTYQMVTAGPLANASSYPELEGCDVWTFYITEQIRVATLISVTDQSQGRSTFDEALKMNTYPRADFESVVAVGQAKFVSGMLNVKFDMQPPSKPYDLLLVCPLDLPATEPARSDALAEAKLRGGLLANGLRQLDATKDVLTNDAEILSYGGSLPSKITSAAPTGARELILLIHTETAGISG